MRSIDQIIEQLRARGHRCGRDCETPSWPGVLKNSHGRWVVLVDDVAMFLGDADDILRGVPIEEIIERNRGANLG
jgi:hypothetical protein